MTGATKSRWLKVTFVKEESTELLDQLVESDFMGIGFAYRGNEDHILYVRAHEGKAGLLKEQLAVWIEQGFVTFEEKGSS